jgi:hypothetical protein
MPDLLAGTTVLAADTPTARTQTDSTDELGFTSTTYIQGGTVVGVVFTAPTTGRVMVIWGVRLQSNTAAVRAVASASVRNGSSIGAGTLVDGATDQSAIESAAQARAQASRHRTVTGLTAGSTYNAVIEHKVSAAGNGDIFDRDIAVIPLP